MTGTSIDIAQICDSVTICLMQCMRGRFYYRTQYWTSMRRTSALAIESYPKDQHRVNISSNIRRSDARHCISLVLQTIELTGIIRACQIGLATRLTPARLERANQLLLGTADLWLPASKCFASRFHDLLVEIQRSNDSFSLCQRVCCLKQDNWETDIR